MSFASRVLLASEGSRLSGLSCLQFMSPEEIRETMLQIPLSSRQRAAICEGLRVVPTRSSESVVGSREVMSPAHEEIISTHEDQMQTHVLCPIGHTHVGSPAYERRSISCALSSHIDCKVAIPIEPPHIGLATTHANSTIDTPQGRVHLPSQPITPATPLVEGGCSSSTPDHSDISYHIDDMRRIIEDTKGKAVICRMRQLVHIAFNKDILLGWRQQSLEKKEYVLDILNNEFPVPHERMAFDRKYMLTRMRKLLSHRRAELRMTVRKNRQRPTYIHKRDFRKAVEEFESTPEKFKQQKEAARRRQEKIGTSHLGSGGKNHFYTYFREIVGREATKEEYMYAFSKTTHALLEKLEEDGVHMNWTNRQDTPHIHGSDNIPSTGPT